MSNKYSQMDKTWNNTGVNWGEYEAHRPPYTEALYELVFRHHQEHGGQNGTALDVGAGGGIVTRVLLDHFDHVIWSDQSAGYMAETQQRLKTQANAGSVTFLQRKFDEFDPEKDFPAGQPVDMIAAGTCIHFGQPAKLMSQLGRLVRSGGTVAAFSYGSIPILPPDDPACPIVKKCKHLIVKHFADTIPEFDDSEGPGTCQARYDNIDFDPAMWRDVRRITSLPKELCWPEFIKPCASRIRDGESQEIVADDFITKEVDYEFFPKYFQNFAPPAPLLEIIKDELVELKTVIGDRKVMAKWPVMIVIATKR